MILEVAFGLGMVIFVHELGHFPVAKWCGVKCEKFYLGFDIGGLKLGQFHWGETEYGIGILPLGGYVKMLGQDDNPARAGRRNASASKLADRERRAADRRAASTQATCRRSRSPIRIDPFDPRSYLAKSVPQRMAIISAGVIMNVIFAFVMAVVAYGWASGRALRRCAASARRGGLASQSAAGRHVLANRHRAIGRCGFAI